MNLFSSKKSYLGVDLGTSAIKIVELQNKGGRAVLVTYGYLEQSTDIVRSSSVEMEERIVGIIKNICQKSHTTSSKAVAALPSFAVFTSIISLPTMKKKDLGQAIKWEAKKFVPLPLEDMILDWKIIPPHQQKKEPALASSQEKNDQEKQKEEDKTDVSRELGKDEKPNAFFRFFNKDKHFSKTSGGNPALGNTKVLLTAAPKTLVQRYLRIFKAAELEIVSLETESFALERSLLGGDSAPVMVVDIGSVSSDIVIIDNNIPVLNRSIDIGGVTITKALIANLNVDITRAEQFKRDIGFSSLSEDDLPEIIKSAIAPIINEIKYCLDIYLSQVENNATIEKIILTGGSAWLPELPKYLSKILDTNVIIGDPWDRIVYPLELKPVLAEIGPRFSVALGLAMREL